MIARRLIVVAVALLLSVQIVRNAAVFALAPLQPSSAAKVWTDHPAVDLSLALADIGTAARERKAIGAHAFAMIRDAAAKAPLSPEPFLVHGVQAQVEGRSEAAKRAFLEAQWRDPRSMAAAYFLANHYLRTGNVLEGLKQTVVLARLSPSGPIAAGPFIAAYARDPVNWPQMRELFRSQSWLEEGVLIILARDAGNADAILALADAKHRSPTSSWLHPLLATLVASGDYARARAIWSSIGGGRVGNDLLFDADFSRPDPPPPFNWSLASSTIGLAERQPGGRLHVIFYGNEDGVLAGQLLLLPPGSYRVQMQIASPLRPETLRWSIRCDKNGSDALSSAAIDQIAMNGWTFEVPQDCPAQRLELSGRSGDIAQQSEATISGLKLTRASAGA